jgi:ClpP class serine protease
MKLSHVIQSVLFWPWSITDAGWRAVFEILRSKLAEPKSAIRGDGSIDESTDIYGQPFPQYENVDGVAIIPVVGTLIHHASLLEKQCGAWSYDDIVRDVRRAVNEGAEKIVLHVDSPGGMSMGSHECAAVVDWAKDFARVEAVTDALMCSAMYNICCGAHAIYATPTAQVGSIGSMIGWLDESVRYQMEGYKVEVFASGDLKGLGTPGTSLTHEQKEHLMEIVLKSSGMFKDRVFNNRGPIPESAMRGQGMYADDALRENLIDGLIDEVEDRFSL